MLFSEAIEQNDYNRLSELLIESKPCKPKEATQALQRAILKKTDEVAPIVQLLLSKMADPNGTDGNRTPFLVLAAEAGCSAIVTLLVDADADPNRTRLSDQSTALHRAVWNNQLECVNILLSREARTESRDSQGRTPLIVSAQGDRTQIMVHLLNNGSDIRARDCKGRTALYWASRLGNTAMAKLIVSMDKSLVDIPDDRGNSSLIMAAERGFNKILEHLVSSGADVDLQNDVSTHIVFFVSVPITLCEIFPPEFIGSKLCTFIKCNMLTRLTRPHPIFLAKAPKENVQWETETVHGSKHSLDTFREPQH